MPRRAWGGLLRAFASEGLTNSTRVSMPRRAWGGLLRSGIGQSRRTAQFQCPEGLGGIATSAGARRIGSGVCFNAPKGLGGIATLVTNAPDAVNVERRFNAPKGLGGLLLSLDDRVGVPPSARFQCPEGLGGDCYRPDWRVGCRPSCCFNAPKGLGGIATGMVRVSLLGGTTKVSMPRRAWGGLLPAYWLQSDLLRAGSFNAPKGLGGIATGRRASFGRITRSFNAPKGLGGIATLC